MATDIGGTFTDLVSVNSVGDTVVCKSHTTPPNFEQGVMDVIVKSGIKPKEIADFIHGTTTIINALTERKGAKAALITTKGFRDILEIARCNRPDLFNMVFAKPRPFIPRYLRAEVAERVSYDGKVVTELNEEDVKEAVEHFKKEGVESIAVCLINSYANDVNELKIKNLVKQLWPEVFVTASVDVTKEWREYERTSTAALNAYVMPVASSYVNKLGTKLDELGCRANKYIMQSNGGTTTFEQAKQTPIYMVESGPVAGVYGAAILGEIIGEKDVISFDVGGTTAKCSLIKDGSVKITTEYRIERTESYAGYPIMSPIVDIVEIGNGGGSIAWIDEVGSLRVGPHSAGALPGPVAYAKGGAEPTTTDACLLTGRLSKDNFDNDVDLESVERAILSKVGEPLNLSAKEAAMDIIRVADSNMLNALKLISVRRGYDPREFALIAFGGGGPMHATYLAKELNIRRVVVPVAAAVFSTWGMLMSDIRHDFIQTKIYNMNNDSLDEINSSWNEMVIAAKAQFRDEGVKDENIEFEFVCDMRYLGQEHAVKVPAPPATWNESDKADIVGRFHDLHEQSYTFKLPDTPAEIVNLHLICRGKLVKPNVQKIKPHDGSVDSAKKETRKVSYADEGTLDTPVYYRDKLGAGAKIPGPAIVEEQMASTVVCLGQTLTVDAYGNLIIDLEVV
jgi:N-methylhydantoinase A